MCESPSVKATPLAGGRRPFPFLFHAHCLRGEDIRIMGNGPEDFDPYFFSLVCVSQAVIGS